MIITNFKNLAKNPFRKKALQIVEAGYEAIDIERTINQRIKLKNNKLFIYSATACHGVDLNNYKHVFLVGIGKGSALASDALAGVLGKRLSEGIAVDLIKPRAINSRLKIFAGTHPLPSARNIKATKKIIKLAEKAGEGDLIISFICGGGSALLCGSQKELKYSRDIFGKLTKAGANILEVNAVRKHLSEIKGGGLAKIAYPAAMVSLIVSDVLGNDLSVVASGPTVRDKTTRKDAEKVLKKYKLKAELLETPKDKKYFKKVKNILFLSNREPVLAMGKMAAKLGFSPKIYSYNLDGEAKKSLFPLVAVAGKNKAIIAGGETTIILGKNPGKGGRSMEAVLGVLKKLQTTNYKQNIVAISFASDGRDNTEAAGAIGDVLTLKKAEKLNLDLKKHLNAHNTFIFFKKTGDLIFIKNKTFNISDLMLVLSPSKE